MNEDLSIVVLEDRPVTVVSVPEITVVRAGVPGIQGPPGPPGGDTYVYTQATPSAVWTVPHNLSRRPSVTIVDSQGRQIFADLRYIDDNIVQITHSVALTGQAYCN